MYDLELLDKELKELVDRNREEELMEADEFGWSVVIKDSIVYYKKTVVGDNWTADIYAPVFEDSDKQKRKTTYANRTPTKY